MNWQSWLFWGVAATLAQTTFEAACQGFRLTRMSLPVMLGTMLAKARPRVKLYGFVLHILKGLLFAMAYIAVFHFLGGPSWWLGALIGAVHAGFFAHCGYGSFVRTPSSNGDREIGVYPDASA